MDDWLFPVLALAAVLGGGIRSYLLRGKRATEAPALPPINEPLQTRSVYTRGYFRMFKVALLVPVVLVPIAFTSIGEFWGLIPLAILFGTGGWRMGSIGAYPEPSGLKIVNFFSTRRVTWGDIDRVEPRDYPQSAKAILANGQTVGISALAMGNSVLREDKEALVLVAEVNHLVQQRKELAAANVAEPKPF